MASSKTYSRILITTAAAFALSACVVHPNSPSDPYPAVSENSQSQVATGPYYYRGTTNNMASMNNDASISANVIQALNNSAGMGAKNLRVSTLNGVVTITGVADNQTIAQNSVQAARQVPGVLRVDYDIEVLRQ